MPTRSLTVAASVAVVFGLLTIVSGGFALFGGADMGAVVPFVLWFNFAAGFAYVAAGLGLWFQTGWALRLTIAIVVATAAVFAAFFWHIATGGAYEARTMAALALRLTVWVILAVMVVKVRQTPGKP